MNNIPLKKKKKQKKKTPVFLKNYFSILRPRKQFPG